MGFTGFFSPLLLMLQRSQTTTWDVSNPVKNGINVLINWCRVSSIHSISNPNNALFRGNPSIDHTIGLFDSSKLQTWTVWTELFHPTCHVSHVSDSLHARSKTLVHLAGFVGDLVVDPAGRGSYFHGTPSWRVIKLDANQDGGNSNLFYVHPELWVFPKIGVPQMDGL